jgi:Protein of unknown function DUF262
MAKFQAQIYKINDVLGWNERHELQLAPGFQRRRVWTLSGKSYLIDSILRGMPLPQFFIRERVLPREKRTIREVIDGQQRLSTIMAYVAGEFTVLPIHNRDFAGTTFERLPEESQTRFLFYPLSINVLEGADDAEVLEIFARLNSYSEPLNTQEILNAKYVGVFRNFVNELAREHLAFWRRQSILTERDIARMKDVELSCELVGAMLFGLLGGKKVIRAMFEDFDQDFPPSATVQPRFAEILQMCQRILGDILPETIYRRPAIFYSLFSAVYDLRYGFGVDQANAARALVPDQIANVQDRLLRLSGAISEGQRDGEFAEFYLAARLSTDKLPQRTIRHNTIRHILEPIFG